MLLQIDGSEHECLEGRGPRLTLIAAFDDVPEHTFEVFTVEDGFVTGVALTGPLAGEYGEPDNEMILRVIST